MAAAAAYRPPLMRALTSYMESTQTEYNVPRSGPNYHTVCGRTAGATNTTPSPTGSRVLDQFKDQIGCPSTGGPLEWAAKRDEYKAQFNKAKQCFSGRVRGLQGHAMTNNASRMSRKTHAHAAQAAYVVGRNCLRKIADVPTALHRYNTSAQALINSVSTTDPGIKTALNAEFPINPNYADSTTNPVLDVGLSVNPILKKVYEETYGLSPAQWTLYHKFLQYSAMKAENYTYSERNIRGSIPTVAEVEREFITAFNPKPPAAALPPPALPPPSAPALPPPSAPPTKKASKASSITEENVLLNRLTSNIAAMRLNTVKPTTEDIPGPIPLPPLESVTGDAYDKLTKDLSRLSFNIYEIVDTWIPPVKLIESLKDKKNHTPINLELFLRTVIMPVQYYQTYIKILRFQLQYIDTGSNFLMLPQSRVRHTKLLDEISAPLILIDSILRKYITSLNEKLIFAQTKIIEPTVLLSDSEAIKRDYAALEKYSHDKLYDVLIANKENPINITLSLVWPYIPRMITQDEVILILKKLTSAKIPIIPPSYR